MARRERRILLLHLHAGDADKLARHGTPMRPAADPGIAEGRFVQAVTERIVHAEALSITVQPLPKPGQTRDRPPVDACPGSREPDAFPHDLKCCLNSMRE